MPMAYMRGPHAHGNDVMRVAKEDRPIGWSMHNLTEIRNRRAPGEISLVPECSGNDSIPDWAIAEVVRTMNPNIPLSPYAIRERACRLAVERRGGA